MSDNLQGFHFGDFGDAWRIYWEKTIQLTKIRIHIRCVIERVEEGTNSNEVERVYRFNE